ncbi:MAG: hypothetical protein J7M34_02080, partial [Anaerolineae bacterium]|nr:hypothetical protein [Anaerolineae bacterium]
MGGRISLHQLRSALVHLYDLDYLETHPLAQELPMGGAEGEAASRGLRLHTILTETIKSLRPSVGVPQGTHEWRRYTILYDRYVLRRPLREIEEKLSLGDRQVRREHRRALATLAVLMRSWLESPSPQATLPQPSETVQETVQRLSPAPRVFSLSQLVEEAVAILVEAGSRRDVVEWRVQPDDLTVYTDRGILHQLLIKLLRIFLRPGMEGSLVSLRAFLDDSNVIVSVT